MNKKISGIEAVYFSPCGATKNVTVLLARSIADALGVPMSVYSYTYVQERRGSFTWTDDTLVVWGCPVYAGRIPNKTLDYINRSFHGSGTPAVCLCTYGNRSFDQTLYEMALIMETCGCMPFAAAAVPVRHVFSHVINTGRPDVRDKEEVVSFGKKIAEHILKTPALSGITDSLPGKNQPLSYYVPRKEDLTPAVFLKTKPSVDPDRCTGCKSCESVCPMGTVRMEKMPVFEGVCIKCQACIRTCPTGAVSITDEDFCSHVRMLETFFCEPKSSSYFL